ncbi:MAG: MATE family efflux transporter [Ensifer adhaerens]
MSDSTPTLHEARRIAELALPLSFIQLAQVAISTTDMVMLGWSGGTAIAVGALGYTLFNLLRTMGFGMLVGTSNLVAQDRSEDVGGEHLAAALIMASIAAIAAAVMLALAGSTLEWFGQDPDISAQVRNYLIFIAPGNIPLFWFYAYRGVVVGRRKANVLLAITLGTVVINAVFDYGFLFGAFGLPMLGIPGVAASSSISFLLQFVAVAVATHRTTRFAPVKSRAEVVGSFRRLLAIGLPTAGSYGSEAGFTLSIALMMGAFGASALAAHAVVNQIMYVVFMLSIGMSHATSVGVSEALGSKDRNGTLRVGRSGFCLGLAVVGLFSVLFCLFPEPILRLFSLDPVSAAQAYGIALILIVMAAFIQVFDFVQNIGVGAVRSVGRAGHGFWITIACYWAFGLPLAWVLGTQTELGAYGVWLGMGAGLVAAGVGMVFLFEQTAARLEFSRSMS